MRSPSHEDNLLRWNDRKKKGFYESHFIKVNQPEDNVAFWWKFTILQPIKGSVQFDVWGIFFDKADPSQTVALKDSFSLDEATVDRDRLYCRYGNNELEHGVCRGTLRGSKSMQWDIRWDVADEGFRHFPKP